ncbi:hypothetical protein PMAYCL1PPCAC_23531, partial [Pristionchus mayeri]
FRMSSPAAERTCRYPLRERSKRIKMGFEVPVWAGKTSVNTCIVDSFLAMLLCTQWKDPSFSSQVKGRSKFTKACLYFLDGDESELEERKENFIRKLFKPNKQGEFDLEGDEANVILDKAKEDCAISLTTHCFSCGREHTSIKDYYYAG